MTSEEQVNYRDYTQTREQHLALPKHDWMRCKSWHCFHGNELNWDQEKRDHMKTLEQQQRRRSIIQTSLCGVAYTAFAVGYIWLLKRLP